MSSTSPESFADDIVAIISHDLRAFDTASDRSQQSRSGILGPSDIGFCRQKAALVTRGIDPTDEKKMWAAQVGTAIHNYVEAALKVKHPDWLMGSIDQLHVTATLPSGAEIGGHPDIVIPDLNTILDIKTVDGFEWVKRNGTSASHKYQRHLYALGAIQQGILDPSQPVYVGNLYFDRSGKEQEPLLLLEPFTHDLSDEIDQWVSDVAYAVMNKEDAMRDIAPSTCVQICEFYSVCRGNLPVHEGQDFTDDPTLKSGIRLAVEASALTKQAKQMSMEAKQILKGFNGTDGEFQVRWTEIAPTFIEGFQRAGSVRMDVVPLKKGK
jgi:hypothetical protein